MSGPTRGGDGTWLRYEAERPESPQTLEAGAEEHQDQAATTDSAWLRHDLPEQDAAPAAGPTHDPVWLAPDVHVDQPAPTAQEAHDTGVPPTIVVQAEESTPPHVSSETRPLPAEAAGSEQADDVARADQAGDAPADAPADSAEDVSTEDDSEGPRSGRRGRDEETVGGLAVLGAAVKEFAIVVGMALVLSFIVKTWLLQAFYIPSGSMEDTLVLNDRVIVSKLTPGPIDLKRGDIIVFADPGEWLDEVPAAKKGPVATAVTETLTFVGLLPDNSENHLIKRVIGLPGDHVVCCDEGGRITINGTAIKEPYLKPGDAASEQDFDITVPNGRVWVMGDHRSNSADSRAHDGPENDGSQGSVDERLIVGRAVALVWPLDHLTWLSNPTATFAQVPAPSGDDAPKGSGPGTGGSDGQGGGEVGGTDDEPGPG